MAKNFLDTKKVMISKPRILKIDYRNVLTTFKSGEEDNTRLKP